MVHLDDVLKKAWLQGFKTKSNYARLRANEVAIAASLGLITTKIGKDNFDRTWHVTRKGLSLLKDE
jgi:hypothetical protein